MKTIDYKEKAKEIRRNILKMSHEAGVSHIGSALSCVDILTVLYFGIMNIDPKKPDDKKRDRFIISKSHAISAVYAVLAEAGFFDKKILKTFCQNKTNLPGHASRKSVPGIEVSTGALGHGLPIGVGMALALKKDNEKSRVFVLLSDGECDEGSNWESALFSAHHKLNNLVAVIDYNKLQALGKTNEVLKLEPLKDKWIAFGWDVKEIDGHNYIELEKTLSNLNKEKPNIIIAHTIKGKGVYFMENKLEWHYKSPTKEEYKLAINEINKQ